MALVWAGAVGEKNKDEEAAVLLLELFARVEAPRCSRDSDDPAKPVEEVLLL